MIEVTLHAENPVEAAIIKAGGVGELGRRMEVSRESIRVWRKAGSFPPDWLQAAAKATGIPHKVLRGDAPA